VLTHKKMSIEESKAARRRPNFVHWEKGGCVFLFIGKCANTSIKAAILEAEGGINPDVPLHTDPRLKYVDRTFVRETDIPIISVVRRPYDRLMSFWRNKVAGWKEREFRYGDIPGLYADMPFRVFLERIIQLKPEQMTDNHIVPATKILQCVNPMNPPIVLKYERLVNPDCDTWNNLRLATGAYLPKELPHVNQSSVPKPVMPAQAAMRLRQRVFEKYRADYDTWGWEI